jgi:hypothetical protein
MRLSVSRYEKRCEQSRSLPNPSCLQKGGPFIPQMNQGAFWTVDCKILRFAQDDKDSNVILSGAKALQHEILMVV